MAIRAQQSIELTIWTTTCFFQAILKIRIFTKRIKQMGKVDLLTDTRLTKISRIFKWLTKDKTSQQRFLRARWPRRKWSRWCLLSKSVTTLSTSSRWIKAPTRGTIKQRLKTSWATEAAHPHMVKTPIWVTAIINTIIILLMCHKSKTWSILPAARISKFWAMAASP